MYVCWTQGIQALVISAIIIFQVGHLMLVKHYHIKLKPLELHLLCNMILQWYGNSMPVWPYLVPLLSSLLRPQPNAFLQFLTGQPCSGLMDSHNFFSLPGIFTPWIFMWLAPSCHSAFIKHLLLKRVSSFHSI